MKAPGARITKIYLKHEAERWALLEIQIKCGTIIIMAMCGCYGGLWKKEIREKLKHIRICELDTADKARETKDLLVQLGQRIYSTLEKAHCTSHLYHT